MYNTLISVDEFMSRRKNFARGDVVFKAAKGAPSSWDPAKRSARFVMSAQIKDRDGDVVYTAGINTDTFMANPICLLNHRSADPIGTWANIAKGADRMEGDAIIVGEGVSPEADKAAALIGAGVLRASSIGFIPKTIKRIVMADGTPTWDYEIIECELVECSIVSVPANAAALAKGAIDGPMTLARDLIEEVLDTWAKDPATGLIVPKAEFEAAHREAGGNKTAGVISIEDDIAEALIKSEIGMRRLEDSLLTKIGKRLGIVKVPEEPAPPALASAESKAAALSRAAAAEAAARSALAA